MTDDAVVLLRRAGQECGHINQCDERYIKAVAETDKTRYLIGCVVIEGTAHRVWLVRHNPDNLAFHTAPPHHRVGGKLLLHLEEASLIHNTVDHFLHIVGMTGIIRHDILELGSLCFKGIILSRTFAPAKHSSHFGGDALSLRRIHHRRLLHPVARQIG